MSKIVCSHLQGGISAAQQRQLEAALKHLYRRHFGAERRVAVLWCELPPGQLFTQGRPSSISFVMVEVDDGLPQPRREAAMLAMAAEWARIAQVELGQLMITLADSTVFARYLAANRERIRPSRRAWFLLDTVIHLLWSRLRRGHLAIKANL